MNIKLVAEKTFNLLKGFGYEVSSYNKEGDLVIDPMEATRFAVESPNILVRLDPLEKHLSLKTGTPGESIEKIRPMLKELAQDYLLDFDYSVFDKQIKPKGEKVDVAKKSKEEFQMSEDMNILKKLAGLEVNEVRQPGEEVSPDQTLSQQDMKDYANVMANLVTVHQKMFPTIKDVFRRAWQSEKASPARPEIGPDINQAVAKAFISLANTRAADDRMQPGILDRVPTDDRDMRNFDEVNINDFDALVEWAKSVLPEAVTGIPWAMKDFGNFQWKSIRPGMDSNDAFELFKNAIIQMRGDQGTGGYTAQNLADKNGMHYQEVLKTYTDKLAQMGMSVEGGTRKLVLDQVQDKEPYNTSIMDNINEASLGKMTGSRKSSYQPLADNVKIIVRHNKDVNEEVRGARSRNIHSILIQRGEEKFKMAENNLSAARAMARHLHNGGETFDEIGEAITEMSREFKKLKEFVNYVRKAKLVNETNEEFVTMAMENINTIKTSFTRLSGVKSYANAVESVKAYNNVELLQDDLDLESKFTETHFDDKVANVMDSLKASASRKNSFENKIITAIESESFNNISELLKEDDLLEFESLNQQLGHQVSKLGYSAKDETLGNYLHSISGRLNAGEQLSQFEYGAIKSCLLSAGQHNVQSVPMTATESYEAFLDRFVD
jgi:hypothetical protein